MVGNLGILGDEAFRTGAMRFAFAKVEAVGLTLNLADFLVRKRR